MCHHAHFAGQSPLLVDLLRLEREFFVSGDRRCASLGPVSGDLCTEAGQVDAPQVTQLPVAELRL